MSCPVVSSYWIPRVFDEKSDACLKQQYFSSSEQLNNGLNMRGKLKKGQRINKSNFITDQTTARQMGGDINVTRTN